MSQTPIEHAYREITEKRRKDRIFQAGILIGILAIVAWSVQVTIISDTDWERLGGLESIMRTILRFFRFDFSLIPHLGVPMLETFLIAYFGTALGLIFALPVAWFGAVNITPSKKILYPFGRFLMTLSRSIHELVWALIFVSAVGLGALPGILAVAMRSVGFISKIISESIENIDPKPIEAIRSVGGNKFQILMYAIIPQIRPTVLGVIIFEWDINIRRSAIMGVVGAGGLGLTFFRQLAMYNYGGVSVVIASILFLILIGEVVSHYLRKAIL